MLVKIYKLTENALPIKPGERTREWMDETPNKFAYRCLPLTIANSTGWDIFPSDDFIVTWDGSPQQTGLQINYGSTETHSFVESVFGQGIFTINTGYLFRTSPDWDLLVTGPPNYSIAKCSPLTGIVETYWSDYTFTMNWKVNEAGSFHWSKDTPICRVLPIPHNYDILTELVDISDEPDQEALYKEWAKSRKEIIDDMRHAYETGRDGEIVKHGQPKTEWQKDYYTGQRMTGERISDHITKRKFPEFVWKT